MLPTVDIFMMPNGIRKTLQTKSNGIPSWMISKYLYEETNIEENVVSVSKKFRLWQSDNPPPGNTWKVCSHVSVS